MSNLAVIYYTYHHDSEPWKDLAYPVVLSIATTRAACSEAGIYLIDASDQENNWSHWPNLLNFQVIRKQAYLKERNVSFQTTLQANRTSDHAIKLVSRVLDIYELSQSVTEQVVMCCDSDVFWVEPILPLECDLNKFCCNRNSGIWYFDRTSSMAWEFFNAWRHVLLLGTQDAKLRKQVETFNAHNTFMCESALRYVLNMPYFKQMTSEIERTENFVLNDKSAVNFKKGVKNVHLMWGKWGKNRGQAAKMFKEVKKNILKVMSLTDLDTLIPGDMKEESLFNVAVFKKLRARIGA